MCWLGLEERVGSCCSSGVFKGGGGGATWRGRGVVEQRGCCCCSTFSFCILDPFGSNCRKSELSFGSHLSPFYCFKDA